MTSKRLWYTLVCFGLLTYGLMSLWSGRLASAARQAPPPPAGLAAPAQPLAMPEFRVSAIDGSNMQSADMAGKVIIVRFWATW
jgi:hypothetical protein